MRGFWVAALVTVAGGAGALARYALSGWVQRRLDTTRPYGTAAVNLAGTVLLAALVVAGREGVLADDVLAIGGAGFCAGFTTFSTWTLETVRLAEQGKGGRRAAAVDLMGHVLAGIVLAGVILTL